MVDLWTPGKTFGYGIVVGGGATYAIMRVVPAYIEKTTERIGENVARRLKEGSNPGYGEIGLELYNRLMSTIEAMNSRITQLEKKYSGG